MNIYPYSRDDKKLSKRHHLAHLPDLTLSGAPNSLSLRQGHLIPLVHVFIVEAIWNDIVGNEILCCNIQLSFFYFAPFVQVIRLLFMFPFHRKVFFLSKAVPLYNT